MRDVVVAGGGPAGSSAAAAAAGLGADVLLLEREQEIASTVRTSGVTWMQDVTEHGIPRDCYNPIDRFGFASPGREVLVDAGGPVAAVLDVRRTYRLLASRAAAAGAEVRTGAAVDGPVMEGGAVAGVRSGGEEIRARMTVDATGFPSTVCTGAGLARGWSRFGAGAEYEGEADNADPSTWWLLVGDRYSPAGYAWIFPLGGGRVRVGVGVGKPESGADPRRILDRMIEEGGGPVGRLGGFRSEEFHYGLIPNEGLARRTVHAGLLMAGDSAGQSNPLVLEGIRHAIRYGAEAGRRAARAAASGATDAASLAGYEKLWRSEIESKNRKARRIQARWLGLSDDQWDEELRIIEQLSAGEMVDFVRGDFGAARLARMAVSHPVLAARQLLGMLR
ncbi:Geranylgeranyl reductase [Nitrosopumilaceae archaeon]|nr:NAD(P)/FAD-dependent oxidoreductase [Nitrosopumilus sp.]CAI9831225.1 Geranylgeranyl reductase [Nitrosopumilaceae archaeon]MDA7944635.1 NAD(P)/FAD-dependent oxidoreductase [Nitrosopumilus sp.]MDA7954606.1 NAD(P)/FAD-dependent oxidoreductase [Nitrosopumilus sp.]MDA7973315.1 NAD(P)/FAD-dependent oxidoreductase [Nitrosopumilus sp.]